MTTKYDVGDEVYIKVKIKTIFKDSQGIVSYGVNILSQNENLAGGHFTMRESEMYSDAN